MYNYGKVLDPKADLTFKKVFGEQPDLMMSFLNAVLPLSIIDNTQIAKALELSEEEVTNA